MISEEILAQIKKTQKFSDAAIKLMHVVNSVNYSANDIIEIIRYDSKLTAIILKMVNSAEFGMRRKVDSIKNAVSMMGAKKILDIAQEIYTRMYLNKPLSGYESDGMWQHSLRTALAAAQLAPLCVKPYDTEKAFTAGILHDIGKNVLSNFLGNTAHSFIDNIDRHRLHDYLEAEESKLGTNHSEVGELLAREWQLPEFICQAIKHHHKPSLAEEEFKPIAYIIHMADIAAMLSCSDQGSDSLLYEVDTTYTDYFHFSGQELEEIILVIDMECEQIQKTFAEIGE
ncbi:MAG: HDOD domain-containing protein [Victivallales bacterium]|nr:HDOD domain-containing protein [Victivallales bacterium]